jgi:hypothetical protein
MIMPRIRPLSDKVLKIQSEIRDKIDSVLSCLDTYTDVKTMIECLDWIDRWEHIQRHGRTIFPCPRSPDKERVVHRIVQLESPLFWQDLSMTETEVVNGYALFKCKEPVMFQYHFNENVKYWKETEQPMSLDEFLQLYNDTACTDWNKKDAHGESFGGFWKYPEGSPEKEKAYDLTRDANGRALWRLPFPKRFLIKSIDIGCETRMESVRYSNFLGVWMERKMVQEAFMVAVCKVADAHGLPADCTRELYGYLF